MKKLLILSIAFLLVFSFVTSCKKKVEQAGRSRTLAEVFIPAVLILIITPTVISFLLPKISMKGVKKRNIRTNIHFSRDLYEAVDKIQN